MKTRRGTNQYRIKRHKDVGAYMIFFIYVMGFFVGLQDWNLYTNHKVQAAPIITPVAPESATLRVVSPTPADVDKNQEQEKIEAYIKTIFGADARVAIAISRNECGPSNPKYPKCNLHTHVENSVGLFQINIESTVAKVHWNRIPGDTLLEKKTWLENPYNNTLLAYWIFQTSGWAPWSAYTSGRYLNSL